MRKPPKDIGVRAEWVRICGGSYRRLGRSAGPELAAAVRCEAEQATPNVCRRRQAAGTAREENANATEPRHEPKETETYSGSVPRVTKVYGCGGLSPLLPVEVEMLLSGARDTLKEMATSGADGHRKLTVSESYREELRVGISGGAKGLVTPLVSRIFGVSDGAVARCVTECEDGENQRKKLKPMRGVARTF